MRTGISIAQVVRSLRSGDWDPGSTDRTAAVGIAGLITAKLADSVTTLVGLLFIPVLGEGNPLMAAVLDRFGIVTGLVVAQGALTVLIIGITEGAWMAIASSRRSPRLESVVRLVGYAPPTAAAGYAAVHNVLLILVSSPRLPV